MLVLEEELLGAPEVSSTDLIPSPLHPFPHTPLPSGNHQNTLHIHDSVSVLLCLGCLLDSIIDIFVFFSILLVFAARSYGDLSSWYCSPGLGELVWG